MHHAHLFKDCEKETVIGLTIKLEYLQNEGYPRYNCLKNTIQNECHSNCNHFIIIIINKNLKAFKLFGLL